MEYRELGATGIRVSIVGFGCGAQGGLFVNGDADDHRAVTARALEGGINYFDTAASYGAGLSERNLGRVLRELRADVVVGTKLRIDTTELPDVRKIVRQRLEEGLRRLDRESVDVLTLHNPLANRASAEGALSPSQAIEQAALAMRDCVDAGLVRFVGFTGLGDPGAIRDVATSHAFDSMQCYYNLLNPSAGGAPPLSAGVPDYAGVLDHAEHEDLGVFAIRVFAAGALSGGARPHHLSGAPAQGESPEFDADVRLAAALTGIATVLDCESIHEVALRFALSHPAVSGALVGFSDLSQLEAALRFTARGPFSIEELEMLRARMTSAIG